MFHRILSASRHGWILMMLAFQAGAGHAQVSVLTQHNDISRDGLNASETILTPANVSGGHFGMLFKVAVDDQLYAQPLVYSGVNIAGGTHNVVYVATTNNSVYAFDADNGTQYWHVNLGTAFKVSNGGFTCTDVLNTSGIMSTPVIDPTTNTMYLVAETYINGTASHNLHALNILTGADQPGSPVQVRDPQFESVNEIQRTALLLANGNIYFSFAGHCDQGSWKGLTFAYNAATLAEVGVFDASPDDNGAGIWMSGNGPAADSNGNVYWVTGNGTWDGENDFSETILKASPTLTLEDWHTPSNYSNLDSGDLDLTASGPMLLANTNLLVAGGKDGVLRLVNTTNMGHLGNNGAVQWFRASGSHIHSLNYFNSNLYMWGQSDYLKVYHFNSVNFNTTPTYTGTIQAIGHPGASLSISANGTTNGILWASTNSQGQPGGLGAWHMTEPGILYAYAVPGMTALWNNNQNVARDMCGNYAKFMPPTVVNGKVYLASFGTAQTNSGQLCVYGATGTRLIPNGTYEITGVYDGQAVDDPQYSKTAGTDMEQYTLNKGPNQQWQVANLGNNVITLTNATSGMALEVSGGSTANSALIDQAPYTGATSQQWNVISVGGGAYELVNANSGEALDVQYGAKTVGQKLDQYPYMAYAWQQWVFLAK